MTKGIYDFFNEEPGNLYRKKQLGQIIDLKQSLEFSEWKWIHTSKLNNVFFHIGYHQSGWESMKKYVPNNFAVFLAVHSGSNVSCEVALRVDEVLLHMRKIDNNETV